MQTQVQAPVVAYAPITAEGVTAAITHAVKSDSKPYMHTAAFTGGAPQYFGEQIAPTVVIANARPFAGALSLDHEGVAFRNNVSAVRDFHDDAEVERVYYPEIVAFLKAETGAREVLIFDHTRRTDTAGKSGFRGPANRAHNDYTHKSGLERVRTLLGEDAVARLDEHPVAQVNVWRPISEPVLRSPLALLDATSVEPGDLIATDHVYADRIGEIYHLAHSPNHRWLYFPKMRRDEVILIKGYDSREDGRARFTPHSAFEDPATPARAPARESIEIRTLLTF
jgi:hypothetical protein